jgi:hypothetical protein
MYRAAFPALWKVNKAIGDEAKQFYFRSKICMDLRLITSAPILQGVSKAWHDIVPSYLNATIRVLHVSSSFLLGEAYIRNQRPGIPRSRRNRQAFEDHSNTDAPLFRLELKKGGDEMEIKSLGEMLGGQQSNLVRDLCALNLPRGARFNGYDMLAAAFILRFPAKTWLVDPGKRLYPIEQWVFRGLEDDTSEKARPSSLGVNCKEYTRVSSCVAYKHCVARLSIHGTTKE